MRIVQKFLRYARKNQQGIHPCSRGRFATGQIASVLIGVLCGFLLTSSEATGSSRVLQSGASIEIVGEGPEGAYRAVIPIHRSGDLRYFSAGVGIEEREAEYPAFPLKIILVAGQKAYLSRVPLTIRDDAGTIQLDIPSAKVNGPWVFVDLPDGIYDITGIRDGETQEKKHVAVRSGSVRTVYLRWP